VSPDARIFAEPELIRVDLQTPARHATPPIGAGAIATAGGPVQTTPRGGSPTAPARAVADSEGRAGDPPVSGAVPFLSPRPPSLRFALQRRQAQGLRRLLDRNPLPPTS
jgi:hypothetical protein